MRLRRGWILPCLLAVFGCAKPDSPAAPGAEATAPRAEAAAPADQAGADAAPPEPALTVPDAPAVESAEPKVILPEAAPAKDEGAEASAASSPLVAAGGAESWGTLRGRFVYDGPPPTPAKLGDKVNKDLECCGRYLDQLVDESLIVGPDGGIADVFVFVRTEGVKIHPDLESKVAPVRMDHKNCRYEPHALVVWAGKQPVEFGNVDEINHSVKFDPLNSAANPAVNNTLAQNQSFEYTFHGDERVPVPVSCAVHQWEGALILPRTNPYAAVSNEDGVFEIANLPTGRLEFQVWQERAGYLAAKKDWKRGRFEIEIQPGDNDLGVIKVDPSLLEKK
jgi:plastocyanin